MNLPIAHLFLCLVPQTPCGSPGPDVTIGDIVGVANFNASGDLEACSFGLKPANVGSVEVDYFANTARHPAFGQSLYRLKTVDGSMRIEEIGQNWLRHGFFALSQAGFCSCAPTNGQHLGIGCNDSLSANLNADPQLLGPRWEVNAATGVFAFPVANPPHSGTLDRRLQVAIADLEPTGAVEGTRYFVEAQCVAPDDAGALLRDNNESHRELTVTGSGTAWTFGLAGTTQRERPAIYAWQDADPGVLVTEVVVPGDGRYLLASRATDLGGGTWHYEYALHNQSSDRSARAFRVPLPVGATYDAAGFHDVAYHSGDGPGNVNFDGTDWTLPVAPDELAFSTQAYDDNASANALRWSTTYNFRFDSTTPPGEGIARIDLFKPGSPETVTIAAVVPFFAPPPPRSLCFGSGPGSGTCPCGNAGLSDRGCDNSIHTGGATLSASGDPSLSEDELLMTSTGELPSVLSLLLQGDLEISPVLFGDGLRCAGGTLKRLFWKSASGGSVALPAAGQLTISARAAQLGDVIDAGETRLYQIYYRDSSATWCPPPQGSGFNATSAVAITWGS